MATAAVQAIANTVNQVFEKYDRNQNGVLDLDETREFVKDTLLDNGMGSQFSEEAFQEVMESFDKDGDGFVGKHELI